MEQNGLLLRNPAWFPIVVRYSLAGYQLGLRNGLVVLVGGLNIFLFSTLFGGLVAEATNQTGCSVEWCFGSSQLTNSWWADTEIVVPLSGDSSFIRDCPLPHWACQAPWWANAWLYLIYYGCVCFNGRYQFMMIYGNFNGELLIPEVVQGEI